MFNFNYCAQIVCDIEGGLTLDPDDNGNWTGGEKGKGVLKGTKHGISAATYPNEDIPNMTRERAEFLLHRDYWIMYSCDEIPEPIRLHYFDVAVNSGGIRAIYLLQKACGFKGVDVDGLIGNKTRAAMKKLGDKKLGAIKIYARMRTDWYRDIVKSKPAQVKYLGGWLGRVLDITFESLYLYIK